MSVAACIFSVTVLLVVLFIVEITVLKSLAGLVWKLAMLFGTIFGASFVVLYFVLVRPGHKRDKLNVLRRIGLYETAQFRYK